MLTDIKTPTKQAKDPPKQLKPQPTKKTPTNQQKNQNFTPNPRCPHTTTAKTPADGHVMLQILVPQRKRIILIRNPYISGGKVVRHFPGGVSEGECCLTCVANLGVLS